ncbi:hypothetical protein PENSUB_11725 [Penicillium subrubescens]|uniref:Zn(2)-C6 fungal-type domain-containing protein n=1 Tax=Penicillium subrubescens TaxID=1316194 RepID=A0A1Q5T2I4_9EURO|nr:hypothetical protein PENSUB_11725 [Penicillium subrubescens]
MRANTSQPGGPQPQPRVSPDSAPSSADSGAPKPREKARRRNRIIHSCLECRRRKLKCDRGNPCKSCQNLGEECLYVSGATTDVQFRQKLVQMKEAKDEIDSSFRETIGTRTLQPGEKGLCRKRSRQLNQGEESEGSESSSHDDFLEPTPLAVHDAAYADEVDDDIEDLGFRIGRMRLGERIGGHYRPRIADEIMSSLQHISKRSSPSVPVILPSIPASEHFKPGPSFTAPSLDFVFDQSPAQDSLLKFIPPRNIADKLLQRYWDAVHPVARVLHRPSFAQRYETLWEAIENEYQVAPSLSALVCAVLFSAVVSMSEEEILESCRVSRVDLKNQLKSGVETSLAKAQLLKTTKFETLQAFVAYLLSMCVDEISRAHTVLTSIAIRIAECMGLHCDPTEYGFSPIECHVRRLVWYQICYLDLKTSEVQGPRPYISYDGYTTQLPIDVTSPKSPQSPNSPPTWNDLIFSSIRFECQEMQRECLLLRNRVDQKKLSLTKAVSKIEEFRQSMDAKYGPYLYTATPGPTQRMAHLVMKLFTSLLYLIILHRHLNSVTYRIPDRLRQIVLTKGTDALEAAVELESAEDLQQWAWYFGAYHQYHTAFLLLVEVFTYPMRREANRLWRCFDFIFAEALSNVPPLQTNNPTLQDIVAHRDIKARYLLTMVCVRMREYRKAKGLKDPVQFKDSMIVLTPQKDGDSSDPRMPLNFAHGEPEPEPELEPQSHSQNAPVRVGVSTMGMHAGMAHLPPTLTIEGEIIPTEVPSVLDNTASVWASSSDSFSPWIQYGESDLDGDNYTRLQPTNPQSYAASATTESYSATQIVEMRSGNADIDPQMLEIDWVNDGNLDVSDDYMWQSYGSYNPGF